MAENGKMQDKNAAKIKDSGDVALMIDGLYNWLSYDLKKLKEEILSEVKEATSKVSDGIADTQKKGEDVVRELKYSYQQNQAAYEEICQVIDDRVVKKLDDMQLGVAPASGEGVSQAALSAMVNAAVEKALGNLDYDKLASAVAAKLGDVHTPVALDNDYVAAKVAERVEPFNYDTLATLVVEKLDEAGSAPYEVVIDKEGVQQIADQVAARLDSEVVADRVAEKVVFSKNAQQEQILDIVMDEESVQAIADAVVEKLPCVCSQPAQAVEEAPVEEAVVEEVVEEPVVEEVVEEPVVEEAVVEEVVEEVEEPVVAEEVAPAAVQELKEEGNELVDAETGLVIRLKRSFTAKMKQSDDSVKTAYSRLKNALRAYKKVNSNVSWHGDRFNFGRDTIARMNICGKTLGLYLALDPNNEEEFKTSVYHQKDVTGQKAYEGTPFMVKVRSDGAVKKALRLIAALAEKYGFEADEEFVEENYVEEYAFQTTKELLEEGLIKQTREKKVALDF